MVNNVYLGFFDKFNLLQSSHGFTYWWVFFFLHIVNTFRVAHLHTRVGTRNRKSNMPQDTDTRYRMMLFWVHRLARVWIELTTFFVIDIGYIYSYYTIAVNWWVFFSPAHCKHVPCSTLTHSANEVLFNIKRKGDTNSRDLSRTSDTTETRNPCVLKVILLSCSTYIYCLWSNLVSFNRTLVSCEISKVNFRTEIFFLVSMSEEIQ
jgi:hypothetical protein